MLQDMHAVLGGVNHPEYPGYCVFRLKHNNNYTTYELDSILNKNTRLSRLIQEKINEYYQQHRQDPEFVMFEIDDEFAYEWMMLLLVHVEIVYDEQLQEEDLEILWDWRAEHLVHIWEDDRQNHAR